MPNCHELQLVDDDSGFAGASAPEFFFSNSVGIFIQNFFSLVCVKPIENGVVE
jgi:hypothetical protein